MTVVCVPCLVNHRSCAHRSAVARSVRSRPRTRAQHADAVDRRRSPIAVGQRHTAGLARPRPACRSGSTSPGRRAHDAGDEGDQVRVSGGTSSAATSSWTTSPLWVVRIRSGSGARHVRPPHDAGPSAEPQSKDLAANQSTWKRSARTAGWRSRAEPSLPIEYPAMKRVRIVALDGATRPSHHHGELTFVVEEARRRRQDSSRRVPDERRRRLQEDDRPRRARAARLGRVGRDSSARHRRPGNCRPAEAAAPPPRPAGDVSGRAVRCRLRPTGQARSPVLVGQPGRANLIVLQDAELRPSCPPEPDKCGPHANIAHLSTCGLMMVAWSVPSKM